MRRRSHVRSLLYEPHDSLRHAGLAPAFVLGPILRNLRLGWPRNRLMQCLQAFLRIIRAIHDRVARQNFRICIRRFLGEILDVLSLGYFAGAAPWLAVGIAARSATDTCNLRFIVL